MKVYKLIIIILILSSCGVYKLSTPDVVGVYATEWLNSDHTKGDKSYPAIELMPNNTVKWFGADSSDGRWIFEDGFLRIYGLDKTSPCVKLDGLYGMNPNARYYGVDGYTTRTIYFDMVLITESESVLVKVNSME